MVDSYPLQWPMNRSRTPDYRKKGDPFHMPAAKIRSDLARELHLMKADDFVISSNLAVRRDGLPYAGQVAPKDPGVALYFERKGNRICISCDQYSTLDANLRAIGKTVEAIRGIERWGTEEMVDAAFTGFAELPANAGQHTSTDAVTWWDALQVSRDASPEIIKAAYRTLMKEAHPDAGGPEVAVLRLNNAYAQAKKEKNF